MSCVSSVRSLRAAFALSIADRMSGFVRFSSPIERAVFALYPARIAA